MGFIMDNLLTLETTAHNNKVCKRTTNWLESQAKIAEAEEHVREQEANEIEAAKADSKILDETKDYTPWLTEGKSFIQYSLENIINDSIKTVFRDIVPDEKPEAKVKDLPKVKGEVVEDFGQMQYNYNLSEIVKRFSINPKNEDDMFLIRAVVSSVLFILDRISEQDVFDYNGADQQLYSTVNSMSKIIGGKILTPKVVSVDIQNTLDKEAMENIKDIICGEFEFLREKYGSSDHMREVENLIYDKMDDLIKSAPIDVEVVSTDAAVTDPLETNSTGSVVTIGFSEKRKKEMIAEAEEAFKDALEDFPHHRFNVVGDMMELVIADMDSQQYYDFEVDPGTVIGNGYNISAACIKPNGASGGVYVNASHADIIKKILACKGSYIMSPEDLQTVYADQFLNEGVYMYLDPNPVFSKAIKDMDQATFRTLERKLTAIFSIWDQNFPPARVRMNHFNSVDDFSLVSDKKVRSPLAHLNETCSTVVPGFKITVGEKGFTMTNKKLEQPYIFEWANK